MTNVDNFSGPVQYLKIYIVEGNYAQIILYIAHFAISSDVRSQYDDLIQGGIIWTVSQFLKGCKSVIVCRWSTFPLLFLDGLVWVISRRTLHWEDGEAGSHSLWPFQTSWGQPAGNKKMPMSNHPIKRVTCPSYWSLRRCCRSTSILSISTPINFAETYKFVQMKLICLSEDLIIPQTQLTTSKTPSCSNGRKMNWTFFSWFGGKSPMFWKVFFCLTILKIVHNHHHINYKWEDDAHQ